MALQKINLGKIELKASTQMRESISTDTIEEYAQAMTDGAIFPPIKVVFDSIKYYMVDGWHRYYAYYKRHDLNVEVDVVPGTERDAVIMACGANDKHGLKRTNGDKKKAVMILLKDEEFGKYSDSQIAKICNVGYTLVSKCREEKAEYDKWLWERNEMYTEETKRYDAKLKAIEEKKALKKMQNSGILTTRAGSQESEKPVEVPQERVYIHNKSGKPTVMNTTNIGKKKSDNRINDSIRFKHEIQQVLIQYKETSNPGINEMIISIEDILG